MKSKIYLYSIVFLLGLFFSSKNYTHGINPYAFQRYTVKDGLSDNNIRALAQDCDGFMWIGTTHGLCRYDGIRFKTYMYDPNDTHSIADNYVHTLFVDSRDNLWILMPQYICRYNRIFDHFERIMLDYVKVNTQPSIGGGITEDSKGNIWIATPNTGLYMVAKGTNEAVSISEVKGGFTCASIDSLDVLWLGKTGSFLRYNTRNGLVNQYHNREPNAHLYSTVSIDGNKGSALFNNKLFTFNPMDTVECRLIPSSDVVNNFEAPYINCYALFNNQKKIVYGTNGKGLYVYDKESKTTNIIRNIPEISSSLSNDLIRQLLVDRNQVLWIASQDGLNRFVQKENAIRSYNNLRSGNNRLIFSNINCFAEDLDSNIWIGSRDGLTRFSPGNETFINIATLKTSQGIHKLDRVRDLTRDEKGNIWIGTRQGLYTQQPGKDLFLYYTANHDPLVGDEILCTHVDRNNILWMGTFGFGVDCIDLKNDSIKYANIKTTNSGLSSNYIKDIIELKRGIYCFATLNRGVDLYNPNTKKFVNIKMDQYTHNYESNSVNQLFEDSKERLWMATWSGLFVFDKKMNLINLFTPEKGMPSNEFSSVMEDKQGGIWVSSSNGITRIIGHENQFHTINYSSHDGFSTNFFMAGSNFCTSNGMFYYGGVNGFDCFNPEQLQIDTISQSPILTGMKLFNKQVLAGDNIEGRVILPTSLQTCSKLEFTHRQNSLTIQFATPLFNNRREITYTYSLEGKNYNRVEATTQIGEAVFHNLLPGEYTFKVSSYNANQFISKPSQLNIVIHPPWWKRGYAVLVYVVLFLLILFLILRFILHEQNLRHNVEIEKLEKEKIRHLNELKINVYTNITHEIRTPLTLILAPLERMLKETHMTDALHKQLLTVQKNAVFLLSLVNQLLDFRKVESEHIVIHQQLMDFSLFTMQIVEVFRPYAEQKKLSLIGQTIDPPILCYLDPELMEKVIYNLLSNAVKFTNEGTIEVQLKKDSVHKQVILSVRDTGIGINQESIPYIFNDFYQAHVSDTNTYSYGTGIGLALAKRYVELHGGTISVESKPSVGSLFEIRFPDNAQSMLQQSVPMSEIEQLVPSTIVPIIEIKQNEPAAFEIGHKNEMSVLIVDDHPDIRQFIASSIQTSYSVLTAENGARALNITEEYLPNVIISDIMMPEMDGYQLCERLKNNPLTCHIPFLFLSSKTSHDAQLEGLLSGANDYITKPFNEALLLAKVSSILKNQAALKERFRAEFNRIVERGEKDQANDNKQYEDPFLKEVIAFIHSRIDLPDLCGQTVEAHFRINKMQLYRKLKAVSGASITEIIRDVRIKKACELLIESYMNVSEISFSVGFTDPYYFSKTFKKVTGVSPVQYKKEYISKQNQNGIIHQDLSEEPSAG